MGDEAKKGKENIISYCDKMMIEMATSVLNNTSIIAENDNIVIEGFCDYTTADDKPARVSYCDIYRFLNDKLTSITSYCVDKKL